MSESKAITSSQLVSYAVAEYERQLTGYAAGITHDLETARDVVQDTFLKLYLQPDPSLIAGPGLKAWLFTVCRNRALDWLRRNRRLVSMELETVPEPAATEPGPGEAAADHEETSEILRFFSRLPANQAECLRLKFQHDLSYREISAATGLSVTNVGYLIHAGLKRLRQLLSHEFPQSDSAPAPGCCVTA